MKCVGLRNLWYYAHSLKCFWTWLRLEGPLWRNVIKSLVNSILLSYGLFGCGSNKNACFFFPPQQIIAVCSHEMLLQSNFIADLNYLDYFVGQWLPKAQWIKSLITSRVCVIHWKALRYTLELIWWWWLLSQSLGPQSDGNFWTRCCHLLLWYWKWQMLLDIDGHKAYWAFWS